MTFAGLIEQLTSLPDQAGQSAWLRARLREWDPGQTGAFAEALKDQAVQELMANPQQALKTAGLLHQLAALSEDPLHRALGLRVEAQARAIGLGEYEDALPLYEQASAIHKAFGDELGQAFVELTRVWALASLGRYAEAYQAGEWAAAVFEKHARWRPLAGLHNNLAMVYHRAGDRPKALAMLEAARSAYLKLGDEGEPFLAGNDLNRATMLYQSGQLEASLQAGQSAIDLAGQLGQAVVAAQAQHNMGITSFRLGHYYQALELFEAARAAFVANGQQHEAAQCDLSSAECLLELRRFREALQKCERIHPLFGELGMRLEAAETLHLQGQAYAHLGRYQLAVVVLERARQLFAEEGNQFWIAIVQLETAALLHRQGQHPAGFAAAGESAAVFDRLGIPVYAAQARLAAARAALALGETEGASRQVEAALAVAAQEDWPFLIYQAGQLRGQLAEARQDPAAALPAYQDAIGELERVRGNVMVEFQAAFLEDKAGLYERAVALSLDQGRPERGLEFAERAKSQALLNLLSGRLDLSLQARQAADEGLVAQVNALRAEREQLLRQGRLTGEEKFSGDPAGHFQAQQQLQQVEQHITDSWHRLLQRHAGYARQASTWQVQFADPRPYLEPGSLLLEYYQLGEELLVFLVSAQPENEAAGVRSCRLPARLPEVVGLLQRLGLNLRAVPFSDPLHAQALTENAQRLLHSLYQLLLEPVAEALAAHPRLIIVPHGPLHYLPFHALYDGRAYLLENHQVSYLPGASFLHYSRAAEPAGAGFLVAGYSSHGELPYAVLEAGRVAELSGGQLLLEGQATLERVRALAPARRALHFACHGDFRADNPLFSGLALADGWLTTLDVFDLRLQASLVTLSACQTGRSVVGGGDELSGLMRAFLVAGARSLALSHWPVEDRATAVLMESFYRKLLAGQAKTAALQEAQLELAGREAASNPARSGREAASYAHPYYWAPFFLVGDPGPL